MLDGADKNGDHPCPVARSSQHVLTQWAHRYCHGYVLFRRMYMYNIKGVTEINHSKIITGEPPIISGCLG